MNGHQLRLFFLIICLSLGTPPTLHAQNALHPETGYPFLTNFTPADFNAEAQTWTAIEDERGVMYFGNNSGLLEYDGSSWRLIQLPNRSNVRSLARDEEGRIWIGGTGELGYLTPDSLGRMSFVSLLDEVPEEYRAFDDVWDTKATENGIYFNVADRIFRWTDGEFKVWPARSQIHMTFYVNGVYYAREWDHGLFRQEGDELVLIPGGERFANTRIYSLLPYDETRLLVGTREEGLFLYDGQRFEPFKTEADDLLAEGALYLPGSVLQDGRFALGTLAHGLLIIDREGKLIQHINRQSGLPNNAVLFTYETRSGDLWLTLDQGITRVETGSPFTQYGEQEGLTSSATWMVRHEGRLFAASNSTGVMYLDPTSRTLRPIEGSLTQVFTLASAGGDLLVAASIDGLYRIEGDRAVPLRASVSDDFVAAGLHVWEKNPNVVFVAIRAGLAVLQKTDSGWQELGTVPGIDIDTWFFDEALDGTIWIGTQNSRIVRVRFPEQAGQGLLDLQTAEVDVYGPEDGVAEGLLLPVRLGDKVYFTSMGQIAQRFDETTERFVEDDILGDLSQDNPLAYMVPRVDAEGRAWVASTYEAPSLAIPQPDGSYTAAPGPLRQLRKDRIFDIYPEDDGVIWLTGEKALIRYDSKRNLGETTTFPPLVRRVMHGEDELLYGGMGEPTPLRIPHGSEALTFAFSAPGTVETARFRTSLEGFDEGWSTWSSATERSYTNLPPGTYTFRVEAEERGEAAYAFEILPPWYRTLWAFGMYAVILGGFVVGGNRFQHRRVLKKERERTELREAQLRAEAAESQTKAVEAEAQVLKAENERNQNVELLSQIGQAITSTLSASEIIETIYEHVNALMDASIFGVGIYNEPKARIDFPATKEKGKMLDPYSNDLDDDNRLAVWCFKNGEEIVIQDFQKEHSRYLKKYEPPIQGEDPASVLYLPLKHQDEVIGVITTQSFHKNAYGEYEINVLRNLATYAAIALDNAAAYRKLDATVGKLNTTVQELQTTQQQLIQQEKLASLGQLTSGIAHEIKNPLNFVNNFAEVNAELARELREALEQDDEEDIQDILDDLTSNAKQIVKHGKRADRIVKNMMEHAQGGASGHYEVNLNKMVDEYVDLSYHGARSRLPNFNVTLDRDYDKAAGNVEMAPQELGRVLINLCNNAFDAVQEKVAKAENGYQPEVRVVTRRVNGQVEIRVKDNGPGISETIKEKIFEPFFTTKPTGTGTGLGLSLSYDIITQGHGGTLTVESTEGEGTTFIITLPG